jgi:glycosyltransferase involved in cell wall biosynthesis
MENLLSTKTEKKSGLISTIETKVAICVTTRNRSEQLSNCLNALQSLSIKPTLIVVSDDSADQNTQEHNRFIVEKYESAVYVVGPQRGVCANRNSALRLAIEQSPDLVSFVDDDICLDQYFLENAIEAYQNVPEKDKKSTIFTGVIEEDGKISEGLKLTFRGYFAGSLKPEVVNIHAAIFPASLFQVVAWDENIFFGYEDAELCLRAKKNGFKIFALPSLISIDTEAGNGTLLKKGDDNKISDYQVYIEAARLYVGVKRYYIISSSVTRLMVFIFTYFVHMSIFLLKKKSLGKFSLILKTAQVDRLFKHKIPDTL